MRILGVDPGSHHLGWGVVDVGQGARQLKHLASGTLHAPKLGLVERLVYLANEMDVMLLRFKPQVAAVEEVFFAKNARSALVLGQARGAILVALARAGMPVHEYSATFVKQAVTGRGRASKDTVAQMVYMLLGLRPDAAAHDGGLDTTDALAAAICHAQYASSNAAWLAGQGAAGEGA